MVDVTLVEAALVVAAGLRLSTRWMRPTIGTVRGFAVKVTAAVAAGVVVARVTYVLVEDRHLLTDVRGLLVVRSGAEFWPGFVAAGVVALFGARKARVPALAMLADGSPFVVLGVGLFEATCLIRDGCLGPESRVGLIPPGFTTRMFPVGLVVATALSGCSLLLYREWRLEPARKLVACVVVIAACRTVASWFLPAIGRSRVGLESLAALGVALAGFSVLTVIYSRRRAVPSVNAADVVAGDLEPDVLSRPASNRRMRGVP